MLSNCSYCGDGREIKVRKSDGKPICTSCHKEQPNFSELMVNNMKRNNDLPKLIMGSGFYTSKSNYDFNILWKFISSYENTRFAGGKPPEPQPLGDFHSLNITAGRSFGNTLQTRVYVEIKNLTDKKFSTVVGYPDYGRRFIIGVRQTFR